MSENASPAAPTRPGDARVRHHVHVLASVFEWSHADLKRFRAAPFEEAPVPSRKGKDGKWIVDQYVPAYRDLMFFEPPEPAEPVRRFRRRFDARFSRVQRPVEPPRPTRSGGTIVGAEIHAFPNGLGVFCLDVDLGPDATLDRLSDVGDALRGFEATVEWEGRGPEPLHQFIEEQVLGGIKIRGDDVRVDEYSGSKLKTFLAVDLEEPPAEELQRQLLYDLGCLVPIGSAAGEGGAAPQRSYLEDVLANRVSVFAQWSALGLFDSFAAVGGGFLGAGRGAAEDKRYDAWRTTYLRLYVYNLHLKYSTQQMSADIDTSASENRDQSERFLLDAHLPRVSYQFLPNLLHAAMRRGLEIDEDLAVLETRIAALSKMMDEEYQKRSSALLLAVSVLSGVQAVQESSLRHVERAQELTGLSGLAFWTPASLLALGLGTLLVRYLWPRRFQAARRLAARLLRRARRPAQKT